MTARQLRLLRRLLAEFSATAQLPQGHGARSSIEQAAHCQPDALYWALQRALSDLHAFDITQPCKGGRAADAEDDLTDSEFDEYES